MFDKVGIIGLGLIGGSLAKAIKKYGLANQIIAYNRSPKNLEDAMRDRAVHMATSTINDVFKDCDIIFLCLPVDINIKIVDQLIGIISPECIVTDVSSTKLDISTALRDKPVNFIGGHPMTGSEKTGYMASNEQIFENAYYIYTKEDTTKQADLDKLVDFTQTIKSIPIVMDVNKHDFVTATISHVPHVIASSLVNIVKELDYDEHFMHDLAAGGFKSLTRIASASPDMWQQVCLSNQENITAVIDHFIDHLNKIKKDINADHSKEVYNFFQDAKDYRDSFIDHKPSTLPQHYGISIDVFDKAGIIAKIASLLAEKELSIKNIGIVNNREHVAGVLEIVFYNREHMDMAITLLESLNYVVYQ